ncbi:MAG: hypothetical protein QXK96_04235, partial [Candidatus Bathyarchaeia archaeon]
KESIAETKPGGAIGYYGVRGFARMWLTPIRAAQLTRDPKDREEFDRAGGHTDKCPDVVGKAARWTVEILLNESK